MDAGTLAGGGTVAGGADVLEEEAGAQETVGPIRRTHVTEE
ncbi:hypothetical protein OG250_14395 [Streptomyces sp. NBC_00487]|nr:MULTISPECIES: hypothetical protein [unclassified Streptomyces]WRY95937.1 hypothetical protein OG889_15035 [Streptomyces sp. NBC_00481]